MKKTFYILIAITALFFTACSRDNTINQEEVLFEVSSGESLSSISINLKNQDIISDVNRFKMYAKLKGADRDLKTGVYLISPKESYKDLLDKLTSGISYSIKITIPEGYNIFEIAQVVEAAGFGPADDFISAASDPDLLARYGLPASTSLEGYLFPETYYVPYNYDSFDIIEMMLDTFDTVVDDDMLAAIDAKGMTLNEVLSMAAIVEKESSIQFEKPMIAGVYYHRLEIDMILQADPTLIYALTLDGVYDGDIRYSHFDYDSPYNTYKYKGLPPYPIANSGETSILAAIYPADVDYLYFCASTNGYHVFAETLEEHNNNVNKYLR